MAIRNPMGRANYQPNSWQLGPRESSTKGFTSFSEPIEGTKQRVRSETFADHYSQARLFYVSQTEPEQKHITAALTFELSKVKTAVIRERMVSHLINIHEDLADRVAAGLGLKTMPAAAAAAMPTRKDLPISPALSILKNSPNSFEGRKLGILVTNNTDADLLNSIKSSLEKEGGSFEIIAPEIAGVTLSDSAWLPANQMIEGAPSVLYDAIVLLGSEKAAQILLDKPAARDFVADAFAHCKFIGFSEFSKPLLDKAGIAKNRDDGVVSLNSLKDVEAFVAKLRKLRIWEREKK